MKVRGLPELKAALATLDQHTRASVSKNALLAGALLIENDAKERVPVLSGTLKRSIGHTFVTDSAKKITAQVGTNVAYAPYVEFGTRRMAAQPYLRPAFDTQLHAAKQEIVSALAEQIAKARS